MSFIGEYLCKIDDKSRALFPAAFKKQLSATFERRFVIKKDIYEKCLILYTREEWERQNELIKQRLNPYNKLHSRFLRAYYKGTAEILLDSSNRLLFPKRLLELAGIEKEIYLSGQDKKIEIWAKEIFVNNDINGEEFSDLADKILGGILD